MIRPEIPDPESTAQQYQRIVDAYGLTIASGDTLGHALISFGPRTEHVVRGRFGLYPFDRAQTDDELALRFDAAPSYIHRLASNTSMALRAGNYARRIDPPLEEIGRALLQPSKQLTHDQRLLIQAYRGLPPYTEPVRLDVLSERFGLSDDGIRKQSRKLSCALLGIDYPSIATGYPRPLSTTSTRMATLTSQLRRRDAGQYASLLTALWQKETRSDWSRIVSQDLANAMPYRASRRAYNGRKVRPLAALFNDNDFVPEANPALSAQYAFNPLLDTAAGHQELLADLTASAKRLTSEDIADLRSVIQDGADAERQIIEDNIGLVFFTARKVRGTLSIGLPPKIMYTTGYEGLCEAARKFNGDLGYAFSPYAVKVIGGYILNGMKALQAQKYGITVYVHKVIRSIHKAEGDILQEQQGRPAAGELDALIAERLRKKVSYIQRYRRIWARAQQISLAHTSSGGNDGEGRAWDGQLAAIDYTNDDRQTAIALRRAFDNIFKTLDLSADDKHILLRLYGIAGDELSEEETAATYNISVLEVRRRERRIRTAIQKSPEARNILVSFLQREDHGGVADI